MANGDIIKAWESVFEARGWQDLVQRTRELRDRTDEATVAAKRFGRAYEIAGASARKHVVQAVLQRQEEAKSRDTLYRRTELEVRRQRLASGAFANEVRQRVQLTREAEKMDRLERRAELRAKYGKFGAAVGEFGERFGRPLGAAATAGAATVGGLTARGFSNTVEMNRFQLELALISRELASAILPQFRFLTRALRDFRVWLESFTPRDQRLLGAGLTAGAGVLAASGASRLLFGMGLGGLAAGGLRVGARVLGIGAAGGAATAAGAGAAGGAVAAGTVAGAAPVAGRLARAASFAGRFARAATPAGLAISAASLAPSDTADTHGLAGTSTEDLQKRLERERQSSSWAGRRLRNTFGEVGSYVTNSVNFLQKQVTGVSYKREDFRAPTTAIEEELERRKAEEAAKLAATAPPKPQRKERVTIADAGFETPMAAFERIQRRVELTNAKLDEPEEDTPSILDDIRSLLRDGLGKIGVPTAPPAR